MTTSGKADRREKDEPAGPSHDAVLYEVRPLRDRSIIGLCVGRRIDRLSLVRLGLGPLVVEDKNLGVLLGLKEDSNLAAAPTWPTRHGFPARSQPRLASLGGRQGAGEPALN